MAAESPTPPDIVGDLSELQDAPGEAAVPAGSKHHLRNRVLAALAVVVVAWIVAAGILVATGAKAADGAADSLEEFSRSSGGDLMGLTRLVSDDTDLSKLRSAEKQLRTARGRFDSPLLTPVQFVPVLGTQVRSARALAHASSTVTVSTLEAFDEVQQLIDDQDNTAEGEAKLAGRLTAGKQLQTLLENLREQIRDLDLGPTEGLTEQLAKARTRFQGHYDEATSTLDEAIAGVRGANSFLRGPNRYLVLAANNGEMRAGSGMFLQVGVMETAEGRFELGDFIPSGDMFLKSPGTTLDPTLESLWGPLSPTQEWRNVNLTPRFDESARMATEMWKSSGRGETDGAMAIDVAGIQQLLEVSGPVTIADASGEPSVISADNVAYELMVQQYVALTNAGQDERRSRLGAVAEAIFESFNSGQVPLAEMLDAFASVGKGRHLLMWSSDPEQQAGWVALGMSGTLSENDMLLSVINRGGNKLDQFLKVSSLLTAKTSPDLRHVNAQITLTNNSPDGLPTYVEGPVPELGLVAGDYLGYLSLTVPGGAGNATSKGGEIVGTAIDGPTKVIVVKVLIPRGGSLNVDIGFDLTRDWTTLDVLASARMPAVEWTAGTRKWSDYGPKTIELSTLD